LKPAVADGVRSTPETISMGPPQAGLFVSGICAQKSKRPGESRAFRSGADERLLHAGDHRLSKG
jgi:hypothetical protein